MLSVVVPSPLSGAANEPLIPDVLTASIRVVPNLLTGGWLVWTGDGVSVRLGAQAFKMKLRIDTRTMQFNECFTSPLLKKFIEFYEKLHRSCLISSFLFTLCSVFAATQRALPVRLTVIVQYSYDHLLRLLQLSPRRYVQ